MNQDSQELASCAISMHDHHKITCTCHCVILTECSFNLFQLLQNLLAEYCKYVPFHTTDTNFIVVNYSSRNDIPYSKNLAVKSLVNSTNRNKISKVFNLPMFACMKYVFVQFIS